MFVIEAVAHLVEAVALGFGLLVSPESIEIEARALELPQPLLLLGRLFGPCPKLTLTLQLLLGSYQLLLRRVLEFLHAIRESVESAH